MSTDKKNYWTEQLTQARKETEELVASLSPQQLQTVIIGEGADWTVPDIVAHLLENERGMSIHVHKIRNGKEPLPPDFDLTRWNAGLKKRVGQTPPLRILLNELAQIRAKTLEVLNSLNDDEWGLQGHHPSRGLITIEQYYETMAGHDRAHVKDIKSALGL